MLNHEKSLFGPNVEDFSVCSWCSTPDGSGKPQAVAMVIKVRNIGDIVLRLKSPERVDEVIRLLKEYKNEVWPKSEAADGQHRHGNN